MTAEITDFIYPPDLEHTSLFVGKYVIQNPTGAAIEQLVNVSETKSNSYTLEIKKSESLTVSGEVKVLVNLFFVC